jgi:hypothetical protein
VRGRATSFLSSLVLLTLSACSAPDRQRAEAALREYFAAGAAGDYARMAELYGGSYEVLQDINPGMDPDDHPALLEQYCRQNGGVCLPVESATGSGETTGGTFAFRVRFLTEAGELFERGPCCGETEGPVVSEFEYTVRFEDGSYLTLELPPYVP